MIGEDWKHLENLRVLKLNFEYDYYKIQPSELSFLAEQI